MRRLPGWRICFPGEQKLVRGGAEATNSRRWVEAPGRGVSRFGYDREGCILVMLQCLFDCVGFRTLAIVFGCIRLCFSQQSWSMLKHKNLACSLPELSTATSPPLASLKSMRCLVSEHTHMHQTDMTFCACHISNQCFRPISIAYVM
jgi:hypothetical protein